MKTNETNVDVPNDWKMENRKLIMKIAYGIIAVLFLVLVGLLIYQQGLIKHNSDNGQPTSSTETVSDSGTRTGDEIQTAPVTAGDSDRLVAQLEEEIASLEYHLEATEEELEMAQEDLTNELNRQAVNMSALIDRDKKVLENPILMNSMRRQTEGMLSEEYGALFERLGLPDEKIQDFKTLMVDNQMQSYEVHLGLMDQSLPEEERNEILQLLEDQEAEFKKQARELLGEEDYEVYDAYVERLRERQFVHGSTLSANLGLSDEKEWALIDALYEARKEVEAEHGIYLSDITQTYSVNQDPTEAMDLQLDIYNSYIDSGRRVLSESQAAQFESIINETIEWLTVYHPPLEQW